MVFNLMGFKGMKVFICKEAMNSFLTKCSYTITIYSLLDL
jgi:hypothetical protein